MTLYCGYAYESGLIAASTQTMLPAALLFALEIFILILFLLNVFKGSFLLKLPVFALTILLQICSILCRTDFFMRYWGKIPDFDISLLLFFLSIGALLLFLALYASRVRILFLLLFILQWGAACFSAIVQINRQSYGNFYMFLVDLPRITGFFALLLTMAAALFLWKRGSRFFSIWSKTALLLMACGLIFLLSSPLFQPGLMSELASFLTNEIASARPTISLRILWSICLISTLAAALGDLLIREFQWQAEKAVLAEKSRLAVESYENLCQQSEETRLLVHDTAKHYSLLRTMVDQSPERIAPYLDELIGQIQQIRPVAICQNDILNIIINGKLNQAAQKGIAVEIVRSDAPQSLPLTDSQMCGLFINILDNAIEAAARVHEHPWIRLDFHCKNQHFVFSCENSRNITVKHMTADHTETISGHGYGMKIIDQIMQPFGKNMVSIKEDAQSYKISIIIPLGADPA